MTHYTDGPGAPSVTLRFVRTGEDTGQREVVVPLYITSNVYVGPDVVADIAVFISRKLQDTCTPVPNRKLRQGSQLPRTEEGRVITSKNIKRST